MKDTLFNAPLPKRFEFDSQVAGMFDDMLERSIPYYQETLKLASHFIAQDLEGALYDLGCSTGNFLAALAPLVDTPLVGIDNSPSMLEKAQEKLSAPHVVFRCEDLLTTSLEDAGAVSLLYTLQFIRPLQRQALLERIFDALRPGGVVVVAEKMMSMDRILDKQMVELYYLYKQAQGYTLNEISFKREALENVLVPYSLQENTALLERAGFKQPEVLFKWVNFGLLFARKA
ncbi:carboxy-S-adenosyl-L-methionine synthase CmoA [Helicobacter ailurogastricus]|uniref:Carboxy-S-adenosyl-L-methionine synthase n=1 Tax=Helicobacter ailurogastricus TaxID=1578720 RepID=A0A0K2Y4Y6_9HELI|nr:carboxy-S-adenosyl-L-methionine synthase CmoA [Helicobacter ailurogastricus]CRF40703.1 tRNA (uridine-5-oxyacetic acid methyl ester) 34 synthase [Helicobacter ailurogastricus]CRF43096.1 tRNA (uridine-5-oxyacetic acid methyl ester) 34 synthase [Helicobacter ailurogastricus]CRF44325.1 tRNA (uridine-5-oxyacetic acid methyl ester) 34 synthase [Helicobacter ailurogastricus]CRF52205.1 tRNA (uridine-5-oxyacetic acid methyl ester) 34 synthase [Helicobacter ailurogastricus]GLH57406.1 tRNA (cmo5U34)-m